MDVVQKISEELNLKESKVKAAVELIDDGNTIPFIARYRKEKTGGLNDEELRLLFERLTYLRNLEERKETVLSSIEEQGALTEELKLAIQNAQTLVAVEDLYRPYKPKKRTRATMAKERGLLSLAELIKNPDTKEDIKAAAEKFIDPEKEVNTVDDAINGALDIIAEDISDIADYRTYIRKITFEKGTLVSEAKDKEAQSVYENYYEYAESLKKIPGHRILAVNRGEKEKFLSVHIDAPEEEILNYLYKNEVNDNSYTKEYLTVACDDSYKRLIAPSIEREVRAELTEKAEDNAISVFKVNLKQLLLSPPITGRTVLGWDPAFRTGCKLAICDPTGKVLDTKVVFPTPPQNKVEEAKKDVKDLIKKYNVSLISLGNGTASRESEKVISEIIKETDRNVSYAIVSEAGASVYSASVLATEEFPNFDVGQRSAASIARRLQDPLAELVKIDPKSLGIGQYQHDMNQKKLSEALDGVVEDSVNKVGVDLNTASFSLLSHIAGVNKTIAKNIVSYREKNGRFKNRKELLKVEKLGPKAFEQCAGFLRISDGEEPLDATAVHPESYDAARKINEIGVKNVKDLKKTSEELGIGEYTLKEIIEELKKPGRDPREEMPAPILKSDVLEMKDLKPGMHLKGTVRNIMTFGAFVDIGVHEDGLVHISELSDSYVNEVTDIVKVGDIVEVRVLSVDEARGRISLSMKAEK
ncbi:MAG: RNA-binding transcriptional accessory protein [Lachnospiraceae bacterium]|nr:RNA-binding transcriptional accessory protein [Lachnospiraceae bacterium]